MEVGCHGDKLYWGQLGPGTACRSQALPSHPKVHPPDPKIFCVNLAPEQSSWNDCWFPWINYACLNSLIFHTSVFKIDASNIQRVKNLSLLHAFSHSSANWMTHSVDGSSLIRSFTCRVRQIPASSVSIQVTLTGCPLEPAWLTWDLYFRGNVNQWWIGGSHHVFHRGFSLPALVWIIDFYNCSANPGGPYG